MAKILVSGLINFETTLRVEGFPIEYIPVRYPFFGVSSSISGVGYNIAKALATLGDDPTLLSVVGRDSLGTLACSEVEKLGLDTQWVVEGLAQTAQSVILVDPTGRRHINTDLKDIQEQVYPEERFVRALEGSSLAVLCNINFSRPMLYKARATGVPIVTDVHAISDLEDPYNRDFMEAATILFMSHERLPLSPEAWARQVLDRYSPETLVIGLGAEGALLGLRDEGSIERIPAVRAREVVSTIGAGDALLSAFVHCYAQGDEPRMALRKAVFFASYKIGEMGGAEGFLTGPELEALYQEARSNEGS